MHDVTPARRGGLLWALEWLAVLTSVLVALLLIYLVAARYYFNSWPSGGVHALSLVAAMWLYMTGALIASQSRQHLVVDALTVRMVSPRVIAWHRLVVSVITLVIICIFAYWVYRMFLWGSRFSATMPGLNLPLWVPQAAIGLNAAGSVCYALRDVGQAVRQLRHLPAQS
ncbi:MAG TPA: TRAP transporter small permease subunit [Burkholderiaceae bacterium]|nr:TRAP transporter small permease subunit [Burkholderiaceae bacterium]